MTEDTLAEGEVMMEAYKNFARKALIYYERSAKKNKESRESLDYFMKKTDHPFYLWICMVENVDPHVFSKMYFRKKLNSD